MDTLILTSLLVLMGISTFTSKEFVIFCRVSGSLAVYISKNIVGKIFMDDINNTVKSATG